ncbi:MAG: hemerythrin domain-containing protein [Thermoleophilia bacterium]|jgi:hemerythrin superfamily protein
MRPTESFRREHEHLAPHIDHIRAAARELPRLPITERAELIGGVMDFLRGSLMRHAEAEEAVLYPEWNRLVGFEQASASLIHDHRAIVAHIERLGRADIEDADLLQELLYGLHALISVHLTAEEDIMLPAFEAAPAEVARAAMRHLGTLEGHPPE